MMLSDLGAEVVRVDRPLAPAAQQDPTDLRNGDLVVGRGRKSVAVDLKQPAGRETVLRLAERADALIEGFRPGVTERLGLGPDDCHARNPRLVYGRITGWGQTGPYAQLAGHDINYIALSGTLAMIGRADGPPTPPINLLGDYGGGGMLLVIGIVSALLEASRSGRGQVVDAAMVDGSALLAARMHGLRGKGQWGPRGTNLLDSGAWFYDVYETSDGRHITLGSLEPQFFAEMLDRLGLSDEAPVQGDRSTWPAMRERVAAVVRTKSRDEWCEVFDGSDACFAPVLDPDEAAQHPHNTFRGTFTDANNVVQPAPAPRFSRTPSAISGPTASPGEHSDTVLSEWGFAADEIKELRDSSAVG
jgi:alpha-methylacyl-CoA racemase